MLYAASQLNCRNQTARPHLADFCNSQTPRIFIQLLSFWKHLTGSWPTLVLTVFRTIQKGEGGHGVSQKSSVCKCFHFSLPMQQYYHHHHGIYFILFCLFIFSSVVIVP
jgi:hypothetical protein